MKTNYILSKLNALLIGVALLAVVPMSCKEDKGYSGDPYFVIEGEPTGITVPVAAKTQAYIVRSNRPWQIVAKSAGTWVQTFPEEGKDDGIFKIIIKRNTDFEPRTADFAFVVDGKELPTLFHVAQSANIPYITVSDTVSIAAGGGVVTVDIDANVEWTHTLSTNSWLTVSTFTPTSVVLSAGVNADVARSATLTITPVVSAYANLTKTITVEQSDAILQENFSWLSYGSTITHTTTGETGYNSWTDDEKAHGWTGTPSNDIATPPVSGVWIYARPGFVKLGKTSVGGDLISPALAAIQGTKDIEVSFKACAYISAAAANIDANELNISIIGPGTITEIKKIGGEPGRPPGKGPSNGSLTGNGALFIIANYPNPSSNKYMADYDYWAPVYSERSFVVTGATAETKIRFLGGPNVGSIPATNRIFLDDIKVILK